MPRIPVGELNFHLFIFCISSLEKILSTDMQKGYTFPINKNFEATFSNKLLSQNAEMIAAGTQVFQDDV